MKQRWIPIVILILSMIGQEKHILLYRIHNTDTWVSQEKHFVILLQNHVLFIGIHDVDALVSQEKLFFSPFSLKLKFVPQI